jgi:hypothetical protein
MDAASMHFGIFQLGESTAMLCVRKSTSSIANLMFQKKLFSFLSQVMPNESKLFITRNMEFMG